MLSRAAITREAGGAFSIEPIDLAPPAADEVTVRIAGVGLCHTDLVFRDQFAPYPLPAVFGHEGAGIVEAVGSAVLALSPGDRVVLGFSSCGACRRCVEHHPSYCTSFGRLNFHGARMDGSTAIAAQGRPVASHFFGQSSFAAHATVRASSVVKVDDDDLRLELLGPLGCGFQTGAGAIMRSMDCQPGSAVVIMGGGPVGQAAVMAAVIRACAAIVMVEPLASRRAMALDLGATQTIDPTSCDVTEALRAIAVDGFDHVLDTSGRPAVIEAGLAVLASRGVLGLVGVPPTPGAVLPVSISGMIGTGRRIMGIMEGDSDPQCFIPELIEYHRSGRFPFERLISTFPLDEINEAVAAQANGECIKAVLIP